MLVLRLRLKLRGGKKRRWSELLRMRRGLERRLRVDESLREGRMLACGRCESRMRSESLTCRCRRRTALLCEREGGVLRPVDGSSTTGDVVGAERRRAG